jgi:hypothetical protein
MRGVQNWGDCGRCVAHPLHFRRESRVVSPTRSATSTLSSETRDAINRRGERAAPKGAKKARSTGNVWERHGLFRYGALVAARIAARRSNVRKKPPRTFELATSNLIIGSGVSRAWSLPACNRAALCFRRNTFVCSAALTKFSIDYLDTAATRTMRRITLPIQAGARNSADALAHRNMLASRCSRGCR